MGRIKFHEAAALAAYRVGKLCSTILFSMVIVYYPLMSLVVLDCCISYWNLNVFSLLTYVLSFLRSIKLFPASIQALDADIGTWMEDSFDQALVEELLEK